MRLFVCVRDSPRACVLMAVLFFNFRGERKTEGHVRVVCDTQLVFRTGGRRGFGERVVATQPCCVNWRWGYTEGSVPVLNFFFRHVRGIVDEENARILFPPVYQKLSVTKHAHIGVL